MIANIKKISDLTAHRIRAKKEYRPSGYKVNLQRTPKQWKKVLEEARKRTGMDVNMWEFR